MLSIRFEDNDTGHNDIVLILGGERWECDSYYFALDRELMPEQEDGDKIRRVLVGLLVQWLAALGQLRDGGTAYLPFDFSDQCTGWLACRRSGDEVIVSWGWAAVEGWSFSPSKVGELFACPRGFRLDGPTVQFSLRELIETVRDSLTQIADSGPASGCDGTS